MKIVSILCRSHIFLYITSQFPSFHAYPYKKCPLSATVPPLVPSPYPTHSVSATPSVVLNHQSQPTVPSFAKRQQKKSIKSNIKSFYYSCAAGMFHSMPSRAAPGFMHCHLALIPDQIILSHRAVLLCGIKARSLSRPRGATQTMKNNSFPD